jgi:hypothetical protein
MEGKTMQLKKTQVAPKHDGRPLLQEVVRTPFSERSGSQSFVTDIRSIISAHNLRRVQAGRLPQAGVLCARN